GEIWCAPVENRANGVIITDGSIGDIGQVKKPLRIEVKDGKIVSLQSDDSELVEKIKELTSVDEMASVIGELGIGLNPNARITGNLLEDEKAGKTAHIAFGNNEEMPNGENNSKTHRDFLFYKPTLKVTYKDGTEKIVIKDGDVI
ncbi:MAG: aminopeptidase, partial [Candidatus Thermoplasmatota archaeon]|nr:aminopeptidase [Candidatus Thermoplasmatota archaeon]